MLIAFVRERVDEDAEAAVDTRNRVKVEPKKRTRSLVFRRAPHLAPQPR